MFCILKLFAMVLNVHMPPHLCGNIATNMMICKGGNAGRWRGHGTYTNENPVPRKEVPWELSHK